MKIRPGSQVLLDFDGDGRGIHAAVREIDIEPGGDVTIESVTDLGCWMKHTAEQYAESGKIIKY